MSKLAILIWIIAAPVFMGMLVTVTLVVPMFADKQMMWIPIAAVCGAVLALPVSVIISKKLKNLTEEPQV
jgi:hypothetical protein